MKKINQEVLPSEIGKIQGLILIGIVSVGAVIIFQPIYLRFIFYDAFLNGLNITNQELGTLVGTFGILAAILYLPSGIIADRFRARNLAVVGFLSSSILVFWYGAMPGYNTLRIIFVLMAFTTVLIWWGIRYKLIRLISDEKSYSKNIGLSFGIFGLAGLLFNVMALWIFNMSPNEATGLSRVITINGILILILGVLSFIFIPKIKGEIKKEPKGFNPQDFVKGITDKGVLLTAFSMFFILFFYMGMSYTTPYLTTVYQVPLTTVSVVGILRNYGIAIIASPILGRIAGRINSPSKVITLISGIAGLCYLSFIFLPKETAYAPIVIGIILIIGFVANGAFGIVSSQLTETRVPIEIFGIASGIISAIGFFPESFMHTWFGRLIDQGGESGFTMIFIIIICASILSILCSLAIGKFAKGKKRALRVNEEKIFENPQKALKYH